MHKDLYYYHKQSSLEIDFVTRYNNELTLIEVKSIVKLIKFVKIVNKYGYMIPVLIKIKKWYCIIDFIV